MEICWLVIRLAEELNGDSNFKSLWVSFQQLAVSDMRGYQQPIRSDTKRRICEILRKGVHADQNAVAPLLSLFSIPQNVFHGDYTTGPQG